MTVDRVDDDDEFALLAENAEDAGFDLAAPPAVRRRDVEERGRRISAIAWGDEPGLVLFHGGAQNAHTWDTTALALGRPLVAVDLPGHGRSDWWTEGYEPRALADAVAGAVRRLAPGVTALGGTGLGASVALQVADRLGAQAGHLVLIDSAPGSDPRPVDGWRTASTAAADVAAFTATEEFPSFAAMVEHATGHFASRAPRALRRGVRHNAVATERGTWRWRWDPAQRGATPVDPVASAAALARFTGRVLVVRGEHSDVVGDEQVAQMRRRHAAGASGASGAAGAARPVGVELVTIPGAGHSVQSDRPVELAQVLSQFLRAQT